jgi:PTH1 family peptidyl-tRNA hydrolase
MFSFLKNIVSGLRFFQPPVPSEPMWLIVGLGNPGSEYEGHRHNVGFMAADAIAARNTFPPFRRKFDADMAEGRIENEKVVILKPLTYMNNSGQSVQQAARFFKVTPNRVMVFHDELDLPPFKVKVKKGGGNGGHNGLKSIDAHLNTNDYWRVRLGIGHPGDKDRVTGYVLGNFSKEEQKTLPDFLDDVATYVPLLLAGKDSEYMTRLSEKNKE